MKLKVLVDNNTYIDQYYCGEPAVCYYIEDEDTKILLDVGYSDLFIKNATAFHIDLEEVTTIAISHGHNDHTRGFQFLFQQYKLPNVKVVAHPNAFKEKIIEGISIGTPLLEKELAKQCNLILSKGPMKVSDNIYFLGEIPVTNDFEIRGPIGKFKIDGHWQDDFVTDDTALAYKTNKGIYIMTGCSHSGICNIMEHAKKVCNDTRILGVLGGFHLFENSPQLQKTIAYFKQNQVNMLYPCHCVSFEAKAEIHKSIPIHEVGVGMEICW